MNELAGKLATVRVSGSPVSFTNESMTDTGDGKTFQITNSSKRIWDYETVPSIKVNGVAAGSGYTVNRLNGTVTFNVVQVGSVTVSGKYLPTSIAAYAYDFTIGSQIDLLDVTKFGDSYKRRLGGLKYAYGTLSHWDITDDYYVTALTGGNVVVIDFQAASGIESKRMFALLEKNEIKAAVNDPQAATVSFISTDELLV